jgi:hypothetical protein
MSRRQEIIDRVDTAFKGILIEEGFNTNLGQNIFPWKLDPFQESKLPGGTWNDAECAAAKPAKNAHEHTINIQVTVYCSSGRTTPEEARKIIEDLYKAIGQDPYWAGKALRSIPGGNVIEADEGNKMISSVTVNFQIVYATKEWEF